MIRYSGEFFSLKSFKVLLKFPKTVFKQEYENQARNTSPFYRSKFLIEIYERKRDNNIRLPTENSV